MHEASLMKDLLHKIETIAAQQGASRVAAVIVRLGALSHISAGHFREHFEKASHGTMAENAHLEILAMTDISDPQAQDIVLESVEIVD